MDKTVESLVTRHADNPAALARFAMGLQMRSDHARAAALAAQALALAPDDPEVRFLAQMVLSQDTPKWHFAIVRDVLRNAAYDAALRRAIRPGMKVLEIGAGTGILSMMAARAGAREVIACEMQPQIAAAAQEIVVRNGYGDRVRIVARESFDLDPDTDLGGPADLLVCELVDNHLLHEGVLPVMADAVERLLKPEAIVIPARGSIRVALAHSSKYGRKQLRAIDGFDLSPFNRLESPYHTHQRTDPGLKLMSAPADLFAFDFASAGALETRHTRIALESTGGDANGIAQWIRLEMDDTSDYENAPGPGPKSCWDIVFYPFPVPRMLVPGETVTVQGSHNGSSVQIWS